MAYFNRERKFLYLFEPRTASRGTLAAMKELKLGSDVGTHHDDVEKLTFWRRQHIKPKDLEGARIICTVRNPFDLLVSVWKHHGESRTRPFVRFIDDCWDSILMQPSNRLLYKEATQFCWFEDLELDLQWTFTDERIKMEHNMTHKTPGKEPWHSYYTDEIMDRLRDRPDWAAYLDKFGYRVYNDGAVELDMYKRAELCIPL